MTYQDLLARGELLEGVIQYIRRTPGTSFVDLERILAPYMPIEGDHQLSPREDLVIWAGMSEQFADLCKRLLSEKAQVEAVATSPMIYMFDGKALTLPVAKSARHYKKPRWLPLVFNPVKAKSK